MELKQDQSLRGDRPISSKDEDRLGFRDIARKIAQSLVDTKIRDGLVIGIEGSWGSGKTSLVELVHDELESAKGNSSQSIISFKPWLIGNRDALLHSLFSEIEAEIQKIAESRKGKFRRIKSKANEALSDLKRFAIALKRLNPIIGAGLTVVGAGDLAKIMDALQSIGGKSEDEPPQLSELRVKLESSLLKLDHKIIIIIDDIDRLEPSEVIEILRLIRSVVDLPNIFYLLCYDRNVLSQSIEHATGIKNGEAYLEKIIQLVFPIPRPEPFQLRQLFSDELLYIFGNSELSENVKLRLKEVIDIEGGRQFDNPRSVFRTLDGIRFSWSMLKSEDIDVADLVWLHIIKQGNPNLYRWIEEYCGISSTLVLGIGGISKTNSKALLKYLHKAMKDNYLSDPLYREVFSDILPGVKNEFGGKSKYYFSIFNEINDVDKNISIRHKRISSPDHYRLYFSYNNPSYSINSKDIDGFSESSNENWSDLSNFIIELHKKQVGGGLSKLDLLFDRIRIGEYQSLESGQRQNLLLSLSMVMDEVYRVNNFSLDWVNSLWDKAERIFPVLLESFDNKQRKEILLQMFESGEAIGWLTSIFRREYFAHGRYGNDRMSETKWFVTDCELNLIKNIILERFKKLSVEETFKLPLPAGVLYAWRQAGDETGPRQRVKAMMKTNDGFLSTLEIFQQRIVSSDRGTFYVLREKSISFFADFEVCMLRLHQLKGITEYEHRAKELIEAANLSKEY